jgi:hypothetical protein
VWVFPTQLKPVVRFMGTIMNRKLLVLAATVFAFCSTVVFRQDH